MTPLRDRPVPRTAFMVAALVLAVPLAVALPLRAELRTYDRHRSREFLVEVQPGQTGRLAGMRWALTRTATTTDTGGLTLPPGATAVRFDVEATADGGRPGMPELRFEGRDRRGRTWMAREVLKTNPQGRRPALRLSLIAAVPGRVADEVELVALFRESPRRERALLFHR